MKKIFFIYFIFCFMITSCNAKQQKTVKDNDVKKAPAANIAGTVTTNNTVKKPKAVLSEDNPLGAAVCISDEGDVAGKNINFTTVKKLIEEGHSPNVKWRGYTPLACAASYGRMDVVKYLIDNGADINISTDGIGFSEAPIVEAAFARHTDIAKYLAQKGAVDTDKALGVAIQHNNIELIKFLVDNNYAKLNELEIWDSGKNYTSIDDYLSEHKNKVNKEILDYLKQKPRL
ncbi:ankyrin repeat protein [Elusimicrobium simillimum]|uniref:ankyrin repeat domain-containing protein n=1 Tax=Elusimicrobium simillimum TaxID=3143438 RepID=UPI003C6EB1C4